MKHILIVALVLAAFAGTSAYAAVELLRETKVAVIGLGDQAVTMYKVVDGETVCYVTTQGRFGSHAVSCVK